MIPKYRKQFNEEFSQEKYELLQKTIAEEGHSHIGFRISESPVFLDQKFQNKLSEVAEAVISQVKSFSEEDLNQAVPKESFVPGDASHFHFLAIDFGICENEKGELEPKLIELQAFPSLFAYQHQFDMDVRKIYPFLNDFKPVLSHKEYVKKLKQVIVGNEDPKNVILMELFPEKQKTNVDFDFTEKYLGIKTVGLTKIIREGRQLYYENQGEKIPIHRIYNRVIFDDLQHYPDLKAQFHLTEDVDVTWVTHPNWFFKISKYILPKLHHAFIPKSYYLSEAPADLDLSQYVLKPLFSFAGSGIDLHPKMETLEKIKDKENYILQKKVHYAPAFLDIKGEYSKAEIRLLYVNPEGAKDLDYMINLVRMTKAEMVNVDFNKKDAIWIGSSIAYFEGDLK